MLLWPDQAGQCTGLLWHCSAFMLAYKQYDCACMISSCWLQHWLVSMYTVAGGTLTAGSLRQAASR